MDIQLKSAGSTGPAIRYVYCSSCPEEERIANLGELQLATCGDDNIVRFWRPDAQVAKSARADTQAPERWHYSGTWPHRNSRMTATLAAAGPSGMASGGDAMQCD